VGVGVDELAQEKLTPLLRLKYFNSISDAIKDLAVPEEITKVFVGFQKYLYQERGNGGAAGSAARLAPGLHGAQRRRWSGTPLDCLHVTERPRLP